MWACDMPENCPPEDIMVPHDHKFFRYALSDKKISADDFKSYAEQNPQKAWGDMLPLAVGLSVIDSLQKAKRNLKLPMFRRYSGIIELQLVAADGVVKQTGAHLSHYTWWRTIHFRISDLKIYSK